MGIIPFLSSRMARAQEPQEQLNSSWADEKASLRQEAPIPEPRPRRRLGPSLLKLCLLVPAATAMLAVQGYYHRAPSQVYMEPFEMKSNAIANQCPAQLSIGPKSHPDLTDKNVNGLFKSEEYRNATAKRLGGAVQIPTEDFDDLGEVGEDERWDIFYDLEKYLKKTFPLLHEKLELEHANTHGLVYTWKGSDESLKPILLTAHQDAVPVAADTREQWLYPPFSGHFDGTYIWGRGVSDCKNNLLGLYESVTALLEQGFEPKRTVVLGFGFDEETSGFNGAAHIGEHLEKKWGKDSFALLVDEGVVGLQKLYGRTFGLPQSSEKGYINMVLQAHLPGGHSSAPPAHTTIGILSEAVEVLENSAAANFPLTLTPHNPFYYTLQCAAEDEYTGIPSELRKAIKDPNGTNRVLELLADDPVTSVLLHTTQAVDIFKAGNKINALPAYAEVQINYRVSSEESLAQVKSILTETVKPVAEKHSLDLYINAHTNSSFKLPEHALSITWSHDLEPSPVSSTKSDVWKHFSGVIKHVFDEEGEGNDVVVAPLIAQGNTDTKYYWGLTDQIYRFGPYRAWHDEGWGGVHDVNERISAESHLEAITFYHELIRVFDEADLA